MNSTYQEMKQTDTKARLYIDAPLAAGAVIALPSDQMHYLLHVLRLTHGAAIGVFNGLDHDAVSGWRHCHTRRRMHHQ